MKATHLTLLCHGQTEAQRVGRFHLADDPLLLIPPPQTTPHATHLLTAPELRTRQTAEVFDLDAQTDNDLRDCDLGHWAGQSLKHLQQDDPASLQRWLADPHATPHQGESIAQLCQRVAAWMDNLPAAGRWQAVTHPMVIRAALLHVLESPLDAFHRIDVLPLSEVQFSRHGQWRLRIN